MQYSIFVTSHSCSFTKYFKSYFKNPYSGIIFIIINWKTHWLAIINIVYENVLLCLRTRHVFLVHARCWLSHILPASNYLTTNIARFYSARLRHVYKLKYRWAIHYDRMAEFVLKHSNKQTTVLPSAARQALGSLQFEQGNSTSRFRTFFFCRNFLHLGIKYNS